MIGRAPWLSLARFTDPRQKPKRRTPGEWLCYKGWHWWRRSAGGWAYGSDATHDYRVRSWYCARRTGPYGSHRWCMASFSGPKELLREHGGL